MRRSSSTRPRCATRARPRPSSGPSRTCATGTVALNHWSALGFGLGVTPWGTFPGHPRHDIGSGTGFVHDALMFSRAEKTVLRAPFRAWPKPVWFGSHRTAHRLAARLVRFEGGPGPRHPPGVFALALRG